MNELFTDSGEITEVGGPLFQGMKRYDARNAVLKKLEELGTSFSPSSYLILLMIYLSLIICS